MTPRGRRRRAAEDGLLLPREHLTARAHLHAGRIHDAERDARRLLDRDPADAEGHHLLGLATLFNDDAEAAVGHLEAAAALAPHVPEIHGNLGEALRRTGRAGEGAEACNRALQLESSYLPGHTNLGACLWAVGDHAGALDCFERALELAPEDAGLHARRADALRELYRVHEAVEAYERALELDPDHAHAHANLGPLLLTIGRAEDALEHCRSAIALDPADGVGHLNLGRCLVALERLDEAMDAYADAHERIPGSAYLLSLIAAVWQETGDLRQADLWYGRALACDPDDRLARCGLASLRIEQDRLDEAITMLRTLLDEAPHLLEAHTALARALWEDGDADGAVELLRAAADRWPQLANLHARSGAVQASAGAVDEAVHSYYRALSQNPLSVPALQGLATTLRGRLDESHVREMDRLLEDPKLRDGSRAQIHNALAFYHDGSGDHELAARHTAEANRLWWSFKSERGWTYDPAEHEAEIDAMIDAFDHAALPRALGLVDERPVFVVGLPRSGTTLTEQILASHPQVFGAGERSFASRGFAQVPARLGRDDPAVECLADAGPEIVGAIGRWHLGKLLDLVDKAGRPAGEVERIVDKLPDNYLLLGWIASVFPKARIVHCRRDPRDVALSCWFTQFSQIRWASDLDHIAHRIVQHHRLMEHWRARVPIVEVDYEALVADQEGTSRRLIDAMGLEWDAACLQFHTTRRLVRTASVTQVRQPIYSRSVGRWKQYATPLAPLLQRLEDAGIEPLDER